MILHFNPRLRFTGNNIYPKITLAVHHNFMNEQSSNDHISSLCKKKQFEAALDAFDFLQKNTNFQIKLGTYANLLSVCSSLRSLQHGRRIHDHLILSNCQPDMILNNHILNMYGKCGSLNDAWKVFVEMTERNVVSWTSMIAGYSQNGQGNDAIKLYIQMLRSGIIPDQFTFGSIIRACSSLGELKLGKQLHTHVIKSEFGCHQIAQNALIAMYTKFGQIGLAFDVFSHMKPKDLISWSSIISGFSQLGFELEALDYFKEMLSLGIFQPNEFIFGSLFSACGNLQEEEYGRQIHGMSIKFALRKDAFTGCSLADMYSKCGSLNFAKTVFYEIERPDLVTWNATIAGFAYVGETNEAILFFSQMRRMGLNPDDITLRSLLCACTSVLALNQGKQIHAYAFKTGFDLVIPVCNTLLSMYAKCSDCFDAFNIFNGIKGKMDVVTWNAILTACIHHNQPGDVFGLFKRILLSQSMPDYITLGNVLGACGKICSFELGNQVHCFAMKYGLMLEISITNGLIDMYTKCASLEKAREIFDCMENPDVVSWSSLIVGYAQFGYGEESLKLFKKMKNLGIKPNQVTIVGVLTACSHVGLVEEGWELLRSMEMEHGIVPTREHFSCVVDLLARAGRINEAEDFINQIQFEPDIVMWKSLLAACKNHNNVEVGKRAAESILKIDPSNSSAHVLLCNLYASTGKWKDFAGLRSLMKQRNVKKIPGQSWIELKDGCHVFVSEDGSHPEREKIYRFLEEMWLQMVDAGYVPLHRQAT